MLKILLSNFTEIQMKQEAEDLFKKKRIDMSIYMHSMHVMCNLSKYILSIHVYTMAI